MKTTKITLTLAAVALAVAASSADAMTRFRNVDSLVSSADGGGQIIVALDIKCSGGNGNFVMQTRSNTSEAYRGCAYLQDNRVVIYWNDGTKWSYAPSSFSRTTATIDL
jgi:hypothetical protein